MSILSHIENSNPFFIPFIIITTITFIHYIHRIKNVPGRLRRICFLLPFTPRTTHMTLCILSLSTFLASLMFEYYFYFGQCMVSERYMDENERLFRQVTSILSTAGIVWWVDMATLLSVLRNQRIVAWDHDTDISLIHPSSHTTWTSLQSQMNGIDVISPAFTLNEIIELLKNKGIAAYYVPERDLLQVRWSTDRFGPHTDVWFWRIVGDTPRTAILTTPETSIYHKKRPYTSIFPLQISTLQTSTLQNVTVMIPKDSHDVSTHEYSHYGGDYMTAQWFRKDCLHNWWQSRYRY